MSSPQVIDSAKMTAQVDRFFRDASRDKQDKAYKGAMAKLRASIAPMDGSRLMTDSQAQQGRIMLGRDVRVRIEKLNRNLFCDKSLTNKNACGVYHKDGVSNLDSPIERYRGTKWVASMPWDFVREFDLVKTKEVEYGEDGRSDTKPAGRIPGWRSVLIRLIKNRLISIPRAEKLFAISKGIESQRWWEQTEGW